MNKEYMGSPKEFKQIVPVRLNIKVIQKMDAIVEQGKYPSRSAFLLQAINDLLEKEQSKLDGRYLVIDENTLEELKKILAESEEKE